MGVTQMIFESHVNALLFALSKLYQHCIAHVNTLGVSLDKAYMEDNWRRILPISEVLIACKKRIIIKVRHGALSVSPVSFIGVFE